MAANTLKLGGLCLPLCKHSLGILFLLRKGPMRIKEICPWLNLSRELAIFKVRLLEKYGIVHRHGHGYALTEEGCKLIELFTELISSGIHYQAIYDTLSCKWMSSIVMKLSAGPRRWNSLLGELRPIRPKVLSERLERLTSYGMIRRLVKDEKPPAVYYELTERGRILAAWLSKRFIDFTGLNPPMS